MQVCWEPVTDNSTTAWWKWMGEEQLHADRLIWLLVLESLLKSCTIYSKDFSWRQKILLGAQIPVCAERQTWLLQCIIRSWNMHLNAQLAFQIWGGKGFGELAQNTCIVEQYILVSCNSCAIIYKSGNMRSKLPHISYRWCSKLLTPLMPPNEGCLKRTHQSNAQ